MSTCLGLDVGSSSVIAGILKGTKVVKESPRTFFKSRCSGSQVEVAPASLLEAVAKALSSLGEDAKNADYLAMAVMCPAWVAMDRKGRALTPIITHQDRRSVGEAQAIEKRIGKARHMKITGCRPFPGGLSSTTWAWYLAHHPARPAGSPAHAGAGDRWKISRGQHSRRRGLRDLLGARPVFLRVADRQLPERIPPSCAGRSDGLGRSDL